MNIKQMRSDLNKIMNSVRFFTGTRETAIAYTSIQEAFMWLGKCLGAMKNPTPTPYSKSFDPNSPVIEKSADRDEDNLAEVYSGKDRTYIIKDLRARLKELSDQAWDNIESQEADDSFKYGMYSHQTAIECDRAILWLGMELAGIKGRN